MAFKWKLYYACNYYLLAWGIAEGLFFLTRVSFIYREMGIIYPLAIIYTGAIVTSIAKSLLSLFLLKRLRKTTTFAKPGFVVFQLCSPGALLFLSVLLYVNLPPLFIPRLASPGFLFDVIGVAGAVVSILITGVLDVTLPSTLQDEYSNIETIGKEYLQVKSYNVLPVKWQLYNVCGAYLLIWPVVIAAAIIYQIVSGGITFSDAAFPVIAMIILGLAALKGFIAIQLTRAYRLRNLPSKAGQLIFYAMFAVNGVSVIILLLGSFISLQKGTPLVEDYLSLLLYLSLALTSACCFYLFIFDLPLLKETKKAVHKK